MRRQHVPPRLPPGDRRHLLPGHLPHGRTDAGEATSEPDQGTLAVSDHRGANTWMFQIAEGGKLIGKSPTMTMRRPIDYGGEFKFNAPPPYAVASGGDGMASDEQGRFYVTSTLGVQVFDAGGRECGLLPQPQADKPLTSCTLAGPGRSYLYITNGDRIYRRKVQAKGSYFPAPIGK